MSRQRFPVVLIVLLLLLVLLVGFGGAPQAGPEVVVERVAPEAVTVGEEVVIDAEAEPTSAAVLPSEPAGENVLASLTTPRSQRMIIKNAEMELLVSDTDVALDSVTLIASDDGGHIISTHTWYEDEFRYATIRLGVPV